MPYEVNIFVFVFASMEEHGLRGVNQDDSGTALAPVSPEQMSGFIFIA